MRHLLLASFVLVSSALASAQSAADGAWTFTMTSPMGSVDAKVVMTAEGGTLTGTFDLGGRVWPIEQGTIKGNEIAFVLNRPGASMTYEMKGTIAADAATGQAMAMGATVGWTMARTK